MTDSVPHLRPHTHGVHLIVAGEPFPIIGGQVHNSSSSERRHFAGVLDRAVALHANTVLAPVSWAQLEPEEGRFDLSLVDGLLAEARGRGLRLVLLWFGAFKNAASTYAPRWVRADRTRFPRAECSPEAAASNPFGRFAKAVLSVFSPALLDADRRAFVALMRHLAQADPAHTVVMVQVENEIGLLGDSRDRSSGAEAAWASEVPAEARAHLGLEGQGTWAELLGSGPDADETFMTWHFARYVEALASAGRAAKPLPMFVNAWLGPQPGQDLPGQYPSGGPVAGHIDLWRAAAPSIDLASPDIYIDDYESVFADYERPGNPLLVPESAVNAARPLVAFGRHAALGFSFFGIDDVVPGGQVAAAYAALRALGPDLPAAQSEGRVAAVALSPESGEQTVRLGDLEITARSTRTVLNRILLDAGVPAPPPPPDLPSETDAAARPAPGTLDPFGLLIRADDDTVIVVGLGLDLQFTRGGVELEIDEATELLIEDGRLRPGRVLNGDERLALVGMDAVGACRIRLLPPAPSHDIVDPTEG